MRLIRGYLKRGLNLFQIASKAFPLKYNRICGERPAKYAHQTVPVGLPLALIKQNVTLRNGFDKKQLVFSGIADCVVDRLFRLAFTHLAD